MVEDETIKHKLDTAEWGGARLNPTDSMNHRYVQEDFFLYSINVANGFTDKHGRLVGEPDYQDASQDPSLEDN
jgi:hypothetical protein